MPMGQNSYRCCECGEYKWCGDCIPTICPECECKAKGHLAIIGTDGVVCARMMTPDAAAELVRRANAYPRLIALLTEALQLKGGWREAIALTEDLTANPVYLKNMMAAIDQIDEWSKFARAALAEADHADGTK